MADNRAKSVEPDNGSKKSQQTLKGEPQKAKPSIPPSGTPLIIERRGF